MAIQQPTRSRGRALPIIIGVILALVGVVGVIFLGGKGSNSGGPEVNVLVVTTTIAKGSTITQGELQLQAVSSTVVPTTAIANPALVIGQIASIAIYQHQIVTTNMLLTTSGVVPNAQLAIPPGDVAISIPTTAASGVNNDIVTGDHIDLLMDWTPQSDSVQYWLEDIVVIQGAAAAGELVVAVPPRQAEELADIVDGTAPVAGGLGTTPKLVAITLRPYSQYGKGALTLGSPVPSALPSGTSNSAITPAFLSSCFATSPPQASCNVGSSTP